MKKWVIGVGLALLAGQAVADTPLTVQQFLENVQVNTTQLPNRVWVRWGTTTPGVYGCYWMDFTRVAEAPKVDWSSAWDYITLLASTFGNQALSAADTQFCYADWPAPTPMTYKVAPSSPGSTQVQTLYSASAWVNSYTLKQPRKISAAFIAPLTSCEADPIVTINTDGRELHYATNADGVRGLAACALMP